VLQNKLCSLNAANVQKTSRRWYSRGVAFSLASGSIVAKETSAESGDLQPSTQMIRVAIRCLLAIFALLARYSFSIIGVTEEDVQRAVSETSDRTECPYRLLRNLVYDGLSKLFCRSEVKTKHCFFAPTLMEYEEEIIGPSLWHNSKLDPKSTRSSLASDR
jgi:hypothetical protein